MVYDFVLMIILNSRYSAVATGKLGYVQEQHPGMYSEASKDNCAMGLVDNLSCIHTQFVEISPSYLLYQSRMAMLDQDVLQSNMTLALLEFSEGKYFTKKSEVSWYSTR